VSVFKCLHWTLKANAIRTALNKGKHRALSPVAGSSSPRAGNTVSSRDQRKHLPSDLDSSGDDEETAQPRKKKQLQTKSKAAATSALNDGRSAGELGSSAVKVKPPTKKQLQDQERAAKKAQKEREKDEKAVRSISIYFKPIPSLMTHVSLRHKKR
jgi:hypothetical protein